MKNLTRVLALVLVFAMMLSTVAFAGAFTDVAADDDYAEAIETLAALGIFKGYEDGTFGADKAITRAEAVAIVNRIQALASASAGAQSVSLYTDVPADHWALGDINLATQMGTVSGDGNGTFRPEDQVSYQEMVKMLTVALGYAPAAADRGGWPTGYLVVAAQYGILEETTNVGAAPATRGVVAQLVFNALNAPIMKQTGYGENKGYTVMDGTSKDTYKETLLTEKLDIYKVAVTPIASNAEAIDGAPLKKAGYVKVELAAKDPWYGVKEPNDFEKTLLKGDSDIDAKLGYAAVAYVAKNTDKEWEVLHSAIEDGKTIVVEIDPATVVGVAGGVIEVEDEDIGLEEEYEYDGDTKVIIDGAKAVGFDTLLEKAFQYVDGSTMEGSITVLFEKNKDEANYIFVKKYKTDMVQGLNPAGTKIYLEQGATINLDEDEVDDLVYTITKDGKEIEPSELAENDIITYRDANDRKFFEIIVTSDTIEGTVTSISKTGPKDAQEKVYTIGGEKYKDSVSGKATGLDNQMKDTPGQEGTFYLDAFGKIAYFKKGAAGAVNVDRDYAYVVNVRKYSQGAFGEELQVRLLDAEGTIKDYVVADTLYLYKMEKDKNGEPESVLYDENVESYEVYVNDLVDASVLATIEGFKDTLVAVEISDDEIDSITVAETKIDGTNDNNEFNLYHKVSDGELEYDKLNGKLGKVYVDENTVIFAVGGSDAKLYTTTDISALDDEETYDADLYVVNTDRLVSIIVMREELVVGNVKSNIAVAVDSYKTKNEEGKTVTAQDFYENGELVTKYLASGAKTIEAGVPFEYKLNEKGEIYDLTAKGVLPTSMDVIANSWGEAADKGADYVWGQVYGKSGSTLRLGDFTVDFDGDDVTDFETHKVAADANVYMVETTRSGYTVEVSELGEVVANKFYKEKLDDGTTVEKLMEAKDADNFFVVLKYVDGDVTDVVVYKNFYNN